MIGKTIARLRRELGVTQEQLALAIGVSAPAVSKWETGQSYPDIALLPPLARFFRISTDALLSFQPSLTDEDMDALSNELIAMFVQSAFAQALTRCDTLLREHPTDGKLRIVLAATLMQGAVYAKDDLQRNTLRARQTELLEDAVRFAQGETQQMAKHLLGFQYIRVNRLEEAESILSCSLPIPMNPEAALPALLLRQGKLLEAEKAGQKNLLAALMEAQSALGVLAQISIRAGDLSRANHYTEAAKACPKVFGVADCYVFCQWLAGIALSSAAEDQEGILDALTHYVDTLIQNRQPSDSPLFDRLHTADPERATQAEQAIRAIRNLVAEDLTTNETYATLRNDPRFISLVHRLADDSK